MANVGGMLQGIFKGPEEYKVSRYDGSELEIEVNADLVRGVDGNPKRMIFVIRDITERRVNEELKRRNSEELQSINEQLVAAEGEMRSQLNAILQGSEELKKATAFTESLSESLPGIFYLYDIQTLRLVRWNRNHQEISGYSDEEMLSRHALDWFRKEDANTVLTAIDACMESGQASIEAPLVMKDGREMSFLLTGKRFNTKERTYLMGVGTDISELKSLETRTRRLNRELLAIKECDRVLVKALTEQELLDEVCRIACDVAGYRIAWIGMAEQDENRTVRPVAWSGHDEGYITQTNVTWAEDGRTFCPIGIAIRTGQTVFINDLTNDGRTGPWKEFAKKNGYRSLIAIPLLDSGKAFGALMMYTDQLEVFSAEEVELLEELAGDLSVGVISLRTKERNIEVEESLKRSEELHSKLLSTVPDFVILTDLKGTIVLVNKPTLRESGYGNEEVVGQSIFSFIAIEDRNKAAINFQSMIMGGAAPVATYHLVMKNGQSVPFEANGDVLRDPEGRPTGLVFIGRNLTVRNRLEQRLSEANNKLRVMNSITRHDIRNQLMTLRGHLLLMEDSICPSNQENLERAEAAAERISSMVEFTKAYEEIGVLSPIWHDIRGLIDRCAKSSI